MEEYNGNTKHIQIKSKHLIDQFCDQNFTHSIPILSNSALNTQGKTAVTEEIFSFSLLDYLSSTSAEEEPNYLIITEKFLKDNLKSSPNWEFLTEINLLQKQVIYIPFLTKDKIWNLGILNNLRLAYDPEFVECNKLHTSSIVEVTAKPKLSIVMFERFQQPDRETSNNLVKMISNFFFFYSKTKYPNSPVDIFPGKGLNVNSFSVNFIKIATSQIKDSGIVMLSLMTHLLKEEKVIQFINTVDFNDYAMEDSKTIVKAKLQERYSLALAVEEQSKLN